MTRRIPALTTIVAALATFAALLVAAAPAAQASEAGEFVAKISAERSSRGLRGYSTRGDLNAVAARHASRMASSGRLYHNPNLGSEVGNWRAIAENVGRGSTVNSLHQALMNSSGHRSNILSSTYTEVGVGTAHGGDGKLYVAQVFRLPMNSGGGSYTAPKPQSVRPAPRRAPRVSRSAPRRPAPVVVVRRAPVRPPSVTPLMRRLKGAAGIVTRERPHGSIECAMAYWETLGHLAP